MYRMSLLILLLIGSVQAQDKPPDKILLPDPPVVQPAAGTPTVLTPDLVYLIRFSEPVMVLASPAGIVSISHDTGPLKIRGRFVDKPDKVETRSFSGKDNQYIVQVEPVTTGRCELLVMPAGNRDGTAVIRRLIDSQIGPAPPPPVPIPPAPVNPLSAKLQAALLADNAPAGTAAKLAAVYLAVAGGVNDPAIINYAQLAIAAAALQNAAVPPSSIPAFRSAVGAYLTAQFGTDGGKAIDRPLAATTFNSLASALQGAK